MTGGLVPVHPAPDRDLVEHLRAIRADGGIPLVCDDRWSAEHAERVRRLCATAEPAPGVGWAGLTSGSGGRPRVVLRSAASWSDSFAAVGDLLGARDGDVLALPAPPSASLTLFSLAHALEGGPRPVLNSGHAAGAADFADATLFHGTPHHLRSLLDAGSPPRLRAALVGGSGLDSALRRRAEALGIRVTAYYGAAELSFVAVDHGDGYVAFPGVEIDVRDGVVWVRSRFVADGYLDDGRGADTAGPFRSADGWHTVGDLAAHSGGALRLLGRADGAVLTASATVIPEDVEAVLRTVDGVGDAVVLGMPHAGIGALLAAVIEPAASGTPATSSALRAAAGRLLAPSHRPRRWFGARLPRTPSGKPARSELARMLSAREVEILA
ncbi:AMP-binding protein [Arthrobacter sp. KK5.5]|uniref:AMP-binding protein n=1 Tax=Arthrobacter sp. KK5.5 TaxID=3373084 RepID=UPI003EE6A490